MITDTEGIILKQTKILGGRRMVLLFSKKYGKISVGTSINEKGKGKSALAMRPFTYGRYELFKNKDSYNINSAEVRKSYYKIGEDVDKYMNSAYILEFTEKLLIEEQPSPGFFNLLTDFLDVMENRHKKYATLVLGYQIKSLKLLGIMPQMNHCTRCGEKKNPIYFSIKDGGIICEDCGKNIEISNNDSLISLVDFGIVDIMNYFLGNPMKCFENLALAQNAENQLQTIIRQYVAYYLDISNLKSENLLT